MLDIVLETGRAVIVCVIFGYLCLVGNKEKIRRQKGWSCILAGFSFILFGILLDITDNFPVLNQFIIIGDTQYQAFLEKIIGYLFGYSLLAYGFWKWMPIVISIKESKRKISKSHSVLEVAIKKYADELKMANEELKQKIEDRRRAEGALRKAHNELETKVEERTSELVLINERLQEEINDRKRTEEELRSSQERHKILFDFAPDAYYLNDSTGTFIDGNKAAEELIGYKKEELIGKNFLKIKLLSWDQIPKAAVLLAKNVMGKATGPDEMILNRKDGRQVEVEIRTFPVKIKGKTSVLGIARDITERKTAQEKLRQSEEKYRQIVENTFDVTFTIDRDGNFSDVNQAFLRRSGYKRDEIIGQNFTIMLLPDDTAPAFEAFEKGLEGEIVEFEMRAKMKDGTCDWFFFINHPIIGKDGTVRGIHGIAREITDLKRTEQELREANNELKATQSQLVQSSKLASIGELAAGVAHELNQPLMVVQTTAQFVGQGLRKGRLETGELMRHLEPVERNTKRMVNIINHLRTFSRQSAAKLTPVDVNKVIEDSFLMIGEQLRLRSIEVQKDLDASLVQICGNANQLEQVFLNLITNARDAIEARDEGQGTKDEGRGTREDSVPAEEVKLIQGRSEFKGKIDIITRMGEPILDLKGKEKQSAIQNPKSKMEQPARRNAQPVDTLIEILFKDSGGGIAAENLDKIFDPFFTTKEVGRGTGLGLSISYGIIKNHQGAIEVAETGSQGTTFRIKLPVLNIEN